MGRLATFQQYVTLGRTIRLLPLSIKLITPLPRSKPISTRTHYVEIEQVSDASDELHLFAIHTSLKPKLLTYKVIIEGSLLVMEVDTGAEVSIISKNIY